MLRTFNRKLRVWQLMNQIQKVNSESYEFSGELGTSLTSNLSSISKQLGDSPDIIIREFAIGNDSQLNGAIIFVDGLVDSNQIDRDILALLMKELPKVTLKSPNQDLLLTIQNQIVAIGQVKRKATVDDLVESILSGDTVLVIEGCQEALVLSTKGWEKRAITEPPSQVVVRGPREGFTENLRTNTAMIRRKIQSPDLTFVDLKIGKRTKTDVCIAYIKGICPDELITEIKKRLKGINTDSILESGYIEEFIEDAPLSPFPTVYNTERPDSVAGKLLEGRAAIIINGTPFALTVPTLFVEFFQTPEDYYSRYFYASLVRSIRFIAFSFNLLSPAIYVALVTFHQEMLPAPLLITIAATREGLPFPSAVEAIGMGLIFEMIKEAGIRLPRPIGQAVSIVGALVIGQTAVSAGLVGAPLVIVVALTAIASFITPALSDLSAIFRVLLVLLGGFLGAFGIMIGLIGILIHLSTLRSFGVPYLAPITPFQPSGLKDTVFRAPWWKMGRRPTNIGKDNQVRQKSNLKPTPSTNQKSNTEE